MGDPITDGLAVLGTVLQIGGASQQAASVAAAGRNQQTIANYEAEEQQVQGQAQNQQMQYQATVQNQQAGQATAAGQAAIIAQKRLGLITQGNATAAGVAGGATGSDIYSIISNIGAQSDYKGMTAAYGDNSEAAQLKNSANLSIYEGQNDLQAANTGATLMRASGGVAASNANAQASAITANSYANAVTSASTLYQKYAPDPNTINYNPSNTFNNNSGIDETTPISLTG